MSGEADVAVGPQAILVEAWNIVQGVISGVVVDAGEIPVFCRRVRRSCGRRPVAPGGFSWWRRVAVAVAARPSIPLGSGPWRSPLLYVK